MVQMISFVSKVWAIRIRIYYKVYNQAFILDIDVKEYEVLMKYTGGLSESIRMELKLFTVENIKDTIVKAIAIDGKYLKSNKKDDKSKSGILNFGREVGVTGRGTYFVRRDGGLGLSDYRGVTIPVIGDGDNRYGNAMSVKRTVKGFIKAEFAGIILEDQGSNEIFDTVDLSLPNYSYESQAVWIRVPQSIKRKVEIQNFSFRGGLHAACHALLNVFLFIYFATLLTWLRSVQILMIPVIIQIEFSCMLSILKGVVFKHS
ncbi:hypothetical protein GIB67_018758 [Kingdonia uniflora]|uniref:Uncharacterized protein n=1 Tax=Kingdonia uniflora TaxID=39325 RepID=A0A7J7LSZ1_9MAGN|nr:hypothetical protein GIB67_018758 [Kingdonia uniflora]